MMNPRTPVNIATMRMMKPKRRSKMMMAGNPAAGARLSTTPNAVRGRDRQQIEDRGGDVHENRKGETSESGYQASLEGT